MAGRPCQVCIHEALAAINKLLLDGSPKSAIASRYHLTESSVQRHRSNCLRYRPKEKPAAAAIAPIAPPESVRFEPEDPKSLIATTARLVDEALSLLENAKKSDDRRTALAALREARDGLALLMRSAGMLAGDATIVLDARKQSIQLFEGLTTEELRRLAAGVGTEAEAC